VSHYKGASSKSQHIIQITTDQPDTVAKTALECLQQQKILTSLTWLLIYCLQS